jgi:hypothetical protein
MQPMAPMQAQPQVAVQQHQTPVYLSPAPVYPPALQQPMLHPIHMPPTHQRAPAVTMVSSNNQLALQILGWAFVALAVFLMIDTTIPFAPVDLWFIVQGVVGIYAAKTLNQVLLGLAIFFPIWPAMYWVAIVLFDPTWDFTSVLGEIIFVFFFLNVSMTLIAIRMYLNNSTMTHEQRQALRNA